MDQRRIAGGSTVPLLLLLVALVGIGAWNYHRNYANEQASQRGRPYAGYSTKEVELLRDAAAGELAKAQGRLERAQRGRVRSARDRGSVATNVAQFGRVTRASDALRDATSTVAERKALKEALDRELSQRSGATTGLARHLARLTTF